MTDKMNEVVANINLLSVVERDILQIIKDCNFPHRTAKSEARARRAAIGILRNALAVVIANDVVKGEVPWSGTLDKYRLVAEWDDRV